jgi:hypothetical protein
MPINESHSIKNKFIQISKLDYLGSIIVDEVVASFVFPNQLSIICFSRYYLVKIRSLIFYFTPKAMAKARKEVRKVLGENL